MRQRGTEAWTCRVGSVGVAGWLRIATVLTIAVVLGLAASPQAKAQCGGICLYEAGSMDNSNSAAGAGARAQDAATVLWNPAGMTRLDGVHLQLGTVLGFSKLNFDLGSGTRPPSNDDGGNLNSFIPLGSAFGVISLTEDLKIGLAFSALYGGGLDYDSGWAGRTMVTENTLVGLQIQPAMAFRFTDWLSIGGGLAVVYMRYDQQLRTGLEPDAATVKINKAEDVALAGTVSAMLEPSDDTRIGLYYRTPSEADLEGDIDNPSPMTANVNLGFKLPQGVNVSVFHQLTPKWALLGDGGWSDWSTFAYNPISIGPISGAIPRDWKDTWRLAGGAHYRLVERLLLQGGVSYDSSPVSASKRLPDIPVGGQYRFSGGLRFDAAENIKLGTGYTFFWSPDMDVDNVRLGGVGAPVLDGQYDQAMVHFLNFTLAVNF